MGRHRAGVRERDRVRVHLGGHQAREMGHVDDEGGTDLVGDLAKPGEVEVPAVARPAGEQHLRPVPARQHLDLVHVHEPVFTPHVVGEGPVIAPCEGLLAALGRVPAMGEVEAEHDLARAAEGMEHGRVRARPE